MKTKKYYAARDVDGELSLFSGKPVRWGDVMFVNANSKGEFSMPLDNRMFPDVTWKNSPKEVEINLK